MSGLFGVGTAGCGVSLPVAQPSSSASVAPAIARSELPPPPPPPVKQEEDDFEEDGEFESGESEDPVAPT